MLGVWLWGATPFVFTCEAGDLVARRGDVERWRFTVDAGRIVGTRGYHSGEVRDLSAGGLEQCLEKMAALVEGSR